MHSLIHWDQVAHQLMEWNDNFDSRNEFENVVYKTRAILSQPQCVDSLRLTDKYMHQYTQIMACRLFSAESLSEPMMAYCYLDRPGWRHYSDVTWALWHLISPDTQELVQQIVQANIKETSKVCITGPLWRESTGDWWIPLTKGQQCRKHFHFRMSSWDWSVGMVRGENFSFWWEDFSFWWEDFSFWWEDFSFWWENFSFL